MAYILPNFNDRYDGVQVAVKGRNPSSLTSLTDIGGCAIALNQGGILATPIKLDISSSSTADASAGTGARTITIMGLGSSQQYQTETITMNGQTIVQSTRTWWRVFAAYVATAGSGLTNAGDIYIVGTGLGGSYTTGVPGTFTAASACCKMLVGTSFGGTCFYTTPQKTGSLWQLTRLDFSAGVVATGGTIIIQSQDWSLATNPVIREQSISLMGVGDHASIDLTSAELIFGPKTDIRVLGLTATAGIVMGAEMFIKRNS